MSAAATSVVIQSVINGPMRIVKGQFLTANAANNTVAIPASYGIQTNPNSVVLVSFTTAALGTPASSGVVGIVNNDVPSRTFAVNYTTAPAAGITVDFIIFG